MTRQRHKKKRGREAERQGSRDTKTETHRDTQRHTETREKAHTDLVTPAKKNSRKKAGIRLTYISSRNLLTPMTTTLYVTSEGKKGGGA